MKVRLSARALTDVLTIRDFIAKENPAGADRVWQRLHEAMMTLRHFPERGAPTRADVRRLVVPGLPYSIVYRCRGEVVEVAAVRHHKRH